MKGRAKRGLQVLRRVHEFLKENEVVAPTGPITKHVAALGTLVAQIDAHAVSQDESQRAFMAATREARRRAVELRRQFLRPISQLARELFPNDEAQRASLAVPKSRDYERLIAAGFAMATRVEELQQRFVDAGFDPDFVERIRMAASGLKAVLNDRSEGFGRRALATAGLDTAFAKGRRQVRLLDTMIGPVLESTPERHAQWRTLSRFERRARDEPAPAPEAGTSLVTLAAPRASAEERAAGSFGEEARLAA